MPRVYLTLLLLTMAPLATLAAEKPNTLSPKEIEEGWILLFDGETNFGWITEGDVKFQEGRIEMGGPKKSTLTTSAAFGPCDIKLEYYQQGNAKLIVGGAAPFVPHYEKKLLAWMPMKIMINEKGLAGIIFTQTAMSTGVGKEKTPDSPQSPLRFEVEGEDVFWIRSVKLLPKSTKPLFNGKDLTGWKIFEDPKRNASKWSVTKEGWLNVKNGPGDLQTEGKYGDFLLQFDCISNGKALNSGIFFRCIANEYQNGYEAQVQNGYKDDDRTKPADFGTGAIYRRIAARKVVSNDMEWFTMTVLAHGNHIATWVNGYQTVDWTDDRPADDNPRKGSKVGAGHLSIQGHDPTTDLSFRNIRILELVGAKK